MAVIGDELPSDTLVLYKGRDFKWSFENLDERGQAIPFPPGRLFFEFDTSPLTTWEFVITGSRADLKVEHPEVNKVPTRTKWQLVFMPAAEQASGGGDPVAIGTVRVIS
ncbi:LtfC-like domain-containing protein [Nocardia sp. IFM 10818]